MPADVRGLRASLSVTFAPDSRVRDLSATPGLELRGPFFAEGGAPLYFTRNVTTGVFAGDEYDVSLRAEAGACVRVSATSATKVHTMPADRARTSLRIVAEAGSRLTYSAPPLILQAESDLAQSTRMTVAEDATLVYSDIVVLGRLAHGERCAFRRFESGLTVTRAHDERLLYTERFSLTPDGGSIDDAVGGFSVIGTMLLVGASASCDCIQHSLAQVDCYAGASDLGGGAVIVKVLANRVDAVEAALKAIDNCIR